MDPQNSGPDCILGCDLKVLSGQSFNSLLQHAAVCRDSICFFSIFILSQQSFLCHNKSFFGSLTLCPARSVSLSILCRDSLMCVYWNNYVATLTIVLRHYSCAVSLNSCRHPIFMSRQHFCLFLLQQYFLYC